MDKHEDGPNILSLGFAEVLYTRWLRDPGSVSGDWDEYFGAHRERDPFARDPRLGPSFRAGSLFGGAISRAGGDGAEAAVLQDKVDQLVRAYRVRGHLVAKIDPLDRPRPHYRELELDFYGLGEAHLDRTFSTRTIRGAEGLTLRRILDRMRTTYCRSIGVQFMHIDDPGVKSWLQERMEGTGNRLELSVAEQVRILTRLTDAAIFEEFVARKFVGAKSFSLEGAESLIPLLDLAIEKAAQDGLDEIVLAMAHRGRLNVLANILGKSPRAIFREFEDPAPEAHVGRGDVKYHLGYSSDWRAAGGKLVHLSLSFNPSHLEFVDPVALGRCRAKQDREGDLERRRKTAILIHGDAAFAGEGVVEETLNLSQLPAYSIGGAIHVVVNNQIGFTTPPEEYRSSTYATDVAKMLQIPIFHVNGEDPEAVAQAIRLAMDFRRVHRRDVVVDMYCYRRRGHNETDEPAFTQPLLYRTIRERRGVRDAYLEHLLDLGGITREEADRIAGERRGRLERELAEARGRRAELRSEMLTGVWSGYHGGPEAGMPEMETGVPVERLSGLLDRMTRLPEGFHAHPKVLRGLERRREMAEGRRPLDWAAAEALAFASLAVEGVPVRLTGQDTARGTFSQRHAVLHDVENGAAHRVLQHLADGQAPVEIENSPLSEAGVLGFEYGYSLDRPEALVVWEAQFGDFVNAAQVVVDQFLSSAEDKWQRLSGIVLLLPHGFEGMGPEHSSARLERFLQLAAEDNLQIVQPTTPAQYFHALRRQVVRPWRKPLVLFAPKSMLRHPRMASSLEDLAQGRFRRVIPDQRDRPVRRILLSSGKIHWTLLERREELRRDDVALVRLEQLYPFPHEGLTRALAPYPDDTPAFWVQEEPENMGAWRFLQTRFGRRLLGRLPLAAVSRPESASPATGSAASHHLEEEQLLAAAFGEGTKEG